MLSGQALPAHAISADNQMMVRDLVRAGAGVGLLPVGLCDDDIAAGRLRPLLIDAVSIAIVIGSAAILVASAAFAS